MIEENIKFIYKIRNSIVHSWKNINTSSRIFVKISIGSLFYFYKISAKNISETKYVEELEIYFNMTDELINWRQILNNEGSVNILNNEKDIEAMMYDRFNMKNIKIDEILVL
jgi:hypothetical protein